MENNQKGNDNKPDDNKLNLVSILITGLVITILLNTVGNLFSVSRRTQVQYSKFVQLVEMGVVETAQFTGEQINFTLKKDIDRQRVESIFSESDNLTYVFEEGRTFYTGAIYDTELLPLLKNQNVTFYRLIPNNNPVLNFVLSWVLPIAIFYGISILILKKVSKSIMGGEGGFGNFMNAGKSNAKLYNIEQKTGVTFSDFAGQEEAKESLTEIVDFLHFPDKYTAIGAKQPKGALLVGSPGTGKTLLAKAVAGEANVPFFSLSGSEFVEMYVGVGASRVRDLFKQASKHAPCIIFIDEIDAIGKSRDNHYSGNDEREQTLNQLLAEMDGFDTSKGIVIIGATNRPEILDKALLRPGRFDRRIVVEKPDVTGREAILNVHAKKVKTKEDINLRQIALATSGASGADLANMINEAALRAVKMGRSQVCQADIMESVEVVIAGKEKKDRILSDKEKRLVAFHEVGHALASALQKDSQPVQKITIVPRTMGALGYTMQMPEEEKYLMSKEEILSQIVTLLAGRAAEDVVFNTATTGASNDMERATKLARSMVAQYGMTDAFGMMSLENVENRYLDGKSVLNCSDATSFGIDKETKAILDSCYKKAVALLSENRRSLDEISEYLIQKETISGEKFMELLKKESGEPCEPDLTKDLLMKDLLTKDLIQEGDSGDIV